MNKHKLFGFTDVDRSADPDYFIRFLDMATAEESFQAYKRRTFELLDLQPGRRILDVGCGTGDDARVMAGRVAPDGEVIAIDSSQAMLAEAQRRMAGTNLPVRFQPGDALRLDFPDESFDGCRCDRTFMHLPDPLQGLREMIRVARPGAPVVVYEVDFETITIDVPDHPLARKVLHSYTDSFRNGWLGRRVPAFYRELGLKQIIIEPFTLVLTYALALQVAGQATVDRAVASGAITEAEGKTWLQCLQTAEDAGRFFSTLSGFLVAGRK